MYSVNMPITVYELDGLDQNGSDAGFSLVHFHQAVTYLLGTI